MEYVNDARDGFQRANESILALEKDREHPEMLDEFSRVFHTLKSSSTMLGFADIFELAHSSEDLISRLKENRENITKRAIDLLFEIIDTLEAMVKERSEKKYSDWGKKVSELKTKISSVEAEGEAVNNNQKAVKGSEMPVIEKVDTVRVHIGLLDSLFNLVGELIITKNRIDTLLSGRMEKELKTTLSSMGRLLSSMQEHVSTARLVPVEEIFRRFPRMVRDLAREKDKKVDLILEGSEIELDKSVLDAITEPLIHLLRNAVDHGIERVEEREKSKKPTAGTIRMTAKRSENHIFIDVEDDGKGIDFIDVKEKAVQSGFIKSEDAVLMQDKDIINLLFSPGFSSAEEVTNISGRGIGLHVVKTATKELGGTVEITTEKGRGTKFSLLLPISTAVMQTLMVEEGDFVFAIPSDIVLETQRMSNADIKEIANEDVLVYKEKVIPFTRLGSVLNIPNKLERNQSTAVILQRGNKILSIGVDEVLGQIDNIIKPFDPIAQGFKGFSGGIIMGDGRVALMLDILTLFNLETLQEKGYSI
ncbi:MAG: chemotaxis protein CheA [Nitrospinae bacterium]|nr:chemotaxis protein CheA [Nitrospinota bacterium]